MLNHSEWFHISSLSRSIKLSCVSDIIWNARIDKSLPIYTAVILGTSITASEDFGVCRNEVAIEYDEDRIELHKLFAILPNFSIPLELNDRKVKNLSLAEPVKIEELGGIEYPELQKDLAAIRVHDTQESPAQQAYILSECDPKVRRIIVERKRNGDPKKLSELKAQVEKEIDTIPF